MKRIVSRVALAALIATTVAPVAQAGILQMLAPDREALIWRGTLVGVPVGLMALGKGMSYLYKKLQKNEFEKNAAQQEETSKKNAAIDKLKQEINELQELRRTLPRSRNELLSSDADRKALAQYIEQADKTAQIPAEFDLATYKLIEAKNAEIKAISESLPAIKRFTLGSVGETVFQTGAGLGITLAFFAAMQNLF